MTNKSKSNKDNVFFTSFSVQILQNKFKNDVEIEKICRKNSGETEIS